MKCRRGTELKFFLYVFFLKRLLLEERKEEIKFDIFGFVLGVSAGVQKAPLYEYTACHTQIAPVLQEAFGFILHIARTRARARQRLRNHRRPLSERQPAYYS